MCVRVYTKRKRCSVLANKKERRNVRKTNRSSIEEIMQPVSQKMEMEIELASLIAFVCMYAMYGEIGVDESITL